MKGHLMERMCQNCDFWEKQKGQHYGSCKRHAPPVREDVYYAYWPITKEQDFCGEYKDRQQQHQ